jgi:hypothetical protein
VSSQRKSVRDERQSRQALLPVACRPLLNA